VLVLDKAWDIQILLLDGANEVYTSQWCHGKNEFLFIRILRRPVVFLKVWDAGPISVSTYIIRISLCINFVHFIYGS